ncbi:MAG: hypothetical protein ABFD50_06850 [Smithella sp.]
MKQRSNLRLLLILTLFFIASGGWLLHLHIHPASKDAEFYIPAVAGFISIFITPALFISRRTTPVAYLINGMTVIIGTITMTVFSAEHLPAVWNIKTILFDTLFANIMVLWGKFALGKALYEMDATIRRPEAPLRTGHFFRYPNMGFWLVHLVTLSIVYTIGYQWPRIMGWLHAIYSFI